MNSNARKPSGFTLLEVMLALFIFAIVITIISQGFNIALRTEEQIDQVQQKLAQLQLAETIITRDMSQMVNRPIRDDRGGLLAPILVAPEKDVLVEFTRSGVVNPFATTQRSTLTRVAYVLEGDRLLRRTWRVLDRAPRTEAEDKLLLTGVSGFTIEWLIGDEFVRADADLGVLPRAVRIVLTQNKLDMTRIIALPGGDV